MLPPPPPVSGFSFGVPASAAAPRSGGFGRKRRAAPRVDTNVLSVRYDSLAQNADDVFAGDAIFCRSDSCRAVFSQLSKLADDSEVQEIKEEKKKEQAKEKEAKDNEQEKEKEQDDEKEKEKEKEKEVEQKEQKNQEHVELEEGQKLWICEFCGTHNAIDIDEEEIPSKDTRDYVLSPAREGENKDVKPSDVDSYVVFCIDTSSSMCSTTEVAGRVQLKGAKAELDLSAFGDLAGEVRQMMMQQRNHMTYVSRLQAVQNAVDRQLEELSKSFPNKRVCLIAFNRDVTIVGDGASAVEVVAGDKLHNLEQLKSIGQRYELNARVGEAYQQLSDKLFTLSEDGPTALGPALVIAIAMASKKAGSNVVVCTDGLANIGLGSLDGDDRDAASKWYESMGAYAALHGVTAQIISIKGSDCALADLGQVAAATGGDVERVDIPQLCLQSDNVMRAQQTLASQVSLTCILHHGLFFRNQDGVSENDGGSVLKQAVGNVSADTESIVEYGVKANAKFDNLDTLPFQVQVEFTALNGMRAMRVISRHQPVTKQREVAVKDVRVELLAANASQQSARLVSKGDYAGASRSTNINRAFLSSVASNAQQQRVMQQWDSDMRQFEQVLSPQLRSRDEAKASRAKSKPRSSSSQQQQQQAPSLSFAAPKLASVGGGARGGGRGGRVGFLSRMFGGAKNKSMKDKELASNSADLDGFSYQAEAEALPSSSSPVFAFGAAPSQAPSLPAAAFSFGGAAPPPPPAPMGFGAFGAPAQQQSYADFDDDEEEEDDVVAELPARLDDESYSVLHKFSKKSSSSYR